MRNAVILSILLLVLGFVWWFLLDSRAPKEAEGVFDIAAYRALIADDDELPTEIRMEVAGEDAVPRYAAETGGGFSPMALYYTAFQIISPSMTTVIGGAVDDLTITEIAQDEQAKFYAESYARLQSSYAKADQIFITHAHLDHVMAITRHAAPESFVDRLKLTQPQISNLPQFAPPGEELAGALRDLAPTEMSGPMRIAPGIVVAPAPGHSEGSLVFFVRRADGQEYFFIGDIVWAMSNIENLKTRPRLLQHFFVKLNEDREAVLAQVRALHEITKAEPDILIVSDHDGAHLQQLVERGALIRGFR